jgi:hypothetical protein
MYANGPKIVTDGLVLCLDAANRKSYPGSGSTWYDLSGNGYNGIINGATYLNSDYGIFDFNGSSNYIDLGSYASNLIFNAPATVSVWFNPDSSISVSNWVFSISNGISDINTDNVDLWGIIYGNSTTSLNNEIFSVNRAINQQSPNLQTSVNVDGITSGPSYQNSWVNFTVVMESNSTIWKCYVNSGLQTLTQSSYWIGTHYGYGDDFDAKANVTLGALKRGNAIVNYFDGSISIVSLYNKALSANEVQQNYNALKGRYGLT